MNYTQIVPVGDCILRVVYTWNPDEDFLEEVVSVDLEQGNIISIMDEGFYEEMIEEIAGLHDEAIPDD